MNKINQKTSKFLWLIKPYNNKLILVLLLSIISLLFELLSLGIFIPIINIIQSPKGVNEIPFFSDIYPDILTFDKFQLLLFFIGLVFLIYFIKSIVNISTSIFHAVLASKIDTYLSVTIFRSIIQRPYEYHSQKNSSSFISTIINEVHQFSELIKYVLTFLVELFVSFGIFVVLLIYNPLSTILILTFSSIFFLLMSKVTKNRLINWGNQRQKFQDLMYKNLKEGFGSIIYIKLKTIGNYFINSFKKSIVSRNIYTTRQYAFSNMPRQILELASIFLLGLIVYLNIRIGEVKFENLILILTFYVIALSRVLPSINRIITSYNFILYSDIVIDKVYEEVIGHQFVKPLKKQRSITDFKNEIKLNNISFKYSDTQTYILNNLNLSIKKHDIFGITGSSGSGKTTLVNVLLGLLKPSKGEILLDGKLVEDSILFNKIVGYVPQNSLILDDSLIKNIVFGSDQNNLDINWMKQCIKLVELDNFVKSLKNGMDTILGEEGSKISGGQKQRIGLARALYSKPKIIVLDEATNALDKKTESSILKTVVNLNKRITFIIVSHDDKVLKICNKKFYM